MLAITSLWRGANDMTPSLVIAILSVGSSFLVIALMAYFSLRSERPGQHCPRCDRSVKAGAQRCSRCHLPLPGAESVSKPDDRAE